ncbi:MAG: DUF721 domain-containing protein [Actinobacteria bacterium]|nr:DUF721 domain-containing protein [Actinomycetota bacterium]MCL5887967.1 DUF721 domain-containing protein [Actinomycetota bacterium]
MSLVPIRNLLSDHKGIRKNQNFIHLSVLISVWHNLVGAQISSNTKVVSFKNGVVKVAVTSSAWATELSAIKHDLILQINNTTGNSKASLRDIVFYVVNNTTESDDIGKTMAQNKPVIKKIPLDDDEKFNLEKSVSCIHNEHLRDLAIKVTALDLEIKKGASTKD